MSPRKTILRELSRTHDGSAPTHTHPATIAGFSDEPAKYQKAVNELLQARLVDGHKGADGRMAIAINEHRLAEVKRELRPIWARPTVWAVITLLVAVGTGLAI